MSNGAADDISVFFLGQGEQRADAVMARLVSFISLAKTSLDMAFYDMRFSDPLKQQLLAALRQRAAAGVRIRICYDADKSQVPNVSAGQDPAPAGTGAFVQSLGYPFRRIGGMKLMHNKYIVRDRGAVWTGSLNMTDDAFTLMENNVVKITSPGLAAYYTEDFEQLWQKEHIETTGDIRTVPVTLHYSGKPASARVMFSPGCGLDIDAEIAKRAANARHRIRICSLLLNSGTLINALAGVLRNKSAAVSGIYDRTQMSEVYRQWQEVPSNRWKIPALQDIIAQAHLAGKNSTPYSPTSHHDFMHNKVLVIDDTVITGSYNFSRSAEFNAENILIIESAALADCYGEYIDHLVQKYGAAPPTAPATP